jgi:hypothetical protein
LTLNQTWNPTDGLFILSCHRSGSTLLRFILDTHPELYCPPEVFLGTTAFYMSNFLSGLEGSRAGDGQSVPVLDWIRGILGEQMARQTVRRGKKIWCEKTPDNLIHLRLIDAIFPRARHLCLHRHALDVVQSATKMIDGIPGFDPYLIRSQGHVETALIRYWIERTRDLLQFERANPGRCFHLQYETMVTQPEKVLGPLFAFLEVPWDPKLLDSVFSSEHDQGMEDHYARFATRIYSTSLGAGRDLSLERVPAKDVREMEELLTQLGYGRLPEAPAAAAAGTAGAAAEAEAPAEEKRTTTVQWLFDSHLPARLRAHPPARSAGSSYKFAIASENGDTGGTWVIDTRRGATRVKAGEGDALCMIELSAAEMLELAAGRTNPLKAFDQGKIKVRGRFELSALRELFDLLRV